MLALLVLLFGITGLHIRSAEACRCAPKPPAAYVKKADQVFLARAVANAKDSSEKRTTFKVLATLKGKTATSFLWTRPANARCSSSFETNAVSLLFVIDGDLQACSGNYPLASQAATFPAYLKATKQQTHALTQDEMQTLIKTALKGYMHGRAGIVANYKPLRDETLKIGGMEIQITASAKRVKQSKGVHIESALRYRDIIYLNGHYINEGLWFRLLLRKQEKGGYELLHHTSIES